MTITDGTLTTALDTALSTDRVDRKNSSYSAQEDNWTLCDDVKEGTPRFREQRGKYLPKFLSEENEDYEARLKMTFAMNHYAQALEDQIGLVFAKEPDLADDVPDGLKKLLENVDGEGQNWKVFVQAAFGVGLDHGHGLFITDYPDTVAGLDKQANRLQHNRPYVTYYSGKAAISHRTTIVGGVLFLTQLVLKEDITEPDGDFGEKEIAQYRVLKQEVIYDALGVALRVGGVSWELWRDTGATVNGGVRSAPTLHSSGICLDPNGNNLPRILVRPYYGGERLGYLHSKPSLLNLAYKNVEETQVGSDYAAVMHKCNVPTPVFIGRGKAKPGQTIQMGQGIDIPLGGDAKMLEPTGAAIKSTRDRMGDISVQIQRLGGFAQETTRLVTAMEAMIFARQRNARLIRAAQSMKDAWEGVLMDIAIYMPELNGQSGSVVMPMDFGMSFDIAFVTLCVDAYAKGALPLEATLYVLKTGKLPEEFEPEEIAIRMMADAAKQQENAMKAMQGASDTPPIDDAAPTKQSVAPKTPIAAKPSYKKTKGKSKKATVDDSAETPQTDTAEPT